MRTTDGTADVAYRRILITTDFSDGTQEALDYAFGIAQRNHSQVTLLHVVQDEDIDLSARDRNSLMKAARKELDDLVPADARRVCRVLTKVEIGLPYRTVLRTLEKVKPDLVVMNDNDQSMLDRTA